MPTFRRAFLQSTPFFAAALPLVRHNQVDAKSPEVCTIKVASPLAARESLLIAADVYRNQLSGPRSKQRLESAYEIDQFPSIKLSAVN
ncbi:MAG: hypothetical protein WCG63_05055 [Opitutaceae bacterium]